MKEPWVPMVWGHPLMFFERSISSFEKKSIQAGDPDNKSSTIHGLVNIPFVPCILPIQVFLLDVSQKVT